MARAMQASCSKPSASGSRHRISWSEACSHSCLGDLKELQAVQRRSVCARGVTVRCSQHTHRTSFALDGLSALHPSTSKSSLSLLMALVASRVFQLAGLRTMFCSVSLGILDGKALLMHGAVEGIRAFLVYSRQASLRASFA